MKFQNNQSMMTDDKFSIFEQKLQELGANPKQEIQNNAVLSDNQVSMSEERAWMLHQQNPISASGPFVLALKLKGQVNIERLQSAIIKLYEGNSNLNLIYKLDDEGELEKIHQSYKTVEMIKIKNEYEARAYLIQKVTQPIDLATIPSIQFSIFQTENEVILGILGHHILMDDNSWKPVFHYLSQYYNQHAVEQSGIKESSSLKFITHEKKNKQDILNYWKDQFNDGLRYYDFPEVYKLIHNYPVTRYGVENYLEGENLANRFVAKYPSQFIVKLSETAKATPFHSITTLFGLYLSNITHINEVDILIPTVEHREITQLDQISSSSNVIPVRVSTNAELSATIGAVRNQILNGISYDLPIEEIFSVTKTDREDIPNILITQFVCATQFLNLDGIEVIPLEIPSLNMDYDLALAVQFDQNKQTVTFELTTGNALSKNAGAIILEKFLEFLQGIDSSKDILANIVNDKSNNYHKDKHLSENVALVDTILSEFRQVLNQPELTATDNFFDKGGHSILATKVIGRLQSKHQVLINIADFFNAPTANELVKFATYTEYNHSDIVIPVAETDIDIIAPLSLLQQTYIEFSDYGRNPIFNIPYALRFSSNIDENAFYLAFKDIIQRHHALRTILIENSEGEILQRIIPMQEFEDYQWFWYSDAQGNEDYQNILIQENYHSFDLFNHFPIRVKFLKDENGQPILSLLIYHNVMDEWSTGILLEDLWVAYQKRINHQIPEWDTIPNQFHQHALEQNHAVILGEHLAYWKQKLGTVYKSKPLLSNKDEVTEIDIAGGFVSFSLNAVDVQKLNHLAKQNNASLFHTLYSTLALAIYLLEGGKKLLLGTSVSGREDIKYQETVGYFTNVVLHHVHFNEEMQISELIKQVKNTIIEGLPYSDVPLGIIEAAVKADDELSEDSLFEIYIQFHAKNSLTGVLLVDDQQDLKFELLEPERTLSKYGLHFELYEEPLSIDNALRVVMCYRNNHYSEDKVALIIDLVQRVFHAMIKVSDHQLNDITDIRKELTLTI
ncbi:peptide synthetase [Acinetobacter qingfengensis]|uniref:Carrier domain-containing protein n=1 Tax=Acinetobacter qingfengensis TaxID=1262585 RepID=A0A1E7R8B9_9GAMM|nr:condensation domain-containing protein [Acinetobacter qingfengensis]KAA8734711.1 peptide synthetase [Acinetobacter qingfengensis]OEY95532.1 hypothetical protein BJI46_12720 [Acinetobacter qingfengensis]